MIGLSDALKIIDNIEDPEDIMMHPDLLEFIRNAEDVGGKVLRHLDTDYLKGFIALLQATGLASLMARADNSNDISLLTALVKSNHSYFKLVTFILKLAIGVATVEEIR